MLLVEYFFFIIHIQHGLKNDFVLTLKTVTPISFSFLKRYVTRYLRMRE